MLRVSKVLYLLSLALPAYKTGNDLTFGLVALIIGPIGLFGLQFTWLANPLLWLGWKWTKAHKYTASTWALLAALAVAASFLLYSEIFVGHRSVRFSTHVGYYVWLLSMAAALAANAHEYRPALLPGNRQ